MHNESQFLVFKTHLLMFMIFMTVGNWQEYIIKLEIFHNIYYSNNIYILYKYILLGNPCHLLISIKLTNKVYFDSIKG